MSATEAVAGAGTDVGRRLRAPSRWRAWELGLWAAIWAVPVLLPAHAALVN